MARVTVFTTAARPVEQVKETSGDAAYQAYQILHAAFIVAPVIAGLDKFFDVLVDWHMYLSPSYAGIVPFNSYSLMYVVGAVEIGLGLVVAFLPRLGAYLLTLWLWAIIANLLLIPGYFDIALRDFGLSLATLALARLSAHYGPGQVK